VTTASKGSAAPASRRTPCSPSAAVWATGSTGSGSSLRKQAYTIFTWVATRPAPPSTAPPGRLDAAAEAGRLRAGGVEHLVLLGGGAEAAALAAAAAATGWVGTLHAPGPLAGAALLDGGAGSASRVVLAFPTLPRDRQPAALAHLRDAVGAGSGDGGRDEAAGATEVAAWTALELLVEGLERVGRDASREGLIEALEGLRDFPTGLTPPISYGPNRRVGSRGSWVVETAPGGTGAAPRAAWVALD